MTFKNVCRRSQYWFCFVIVFLCASFDLVLATCLVVVFLLAVPSSCWNQTCRMCCQKHWCKTFHALHFFGGNIEKPREDYGSYILWYVAPSPYISYMFCSIDYQWMVTLPETNIIPENRPSQKDIHLQPLSFGGYVRLRDGRCLLMMVVYTSRKLVSMETLADKTYMTKE